MKKKRRILFLTTEISPFNPESPLAELSRHLSRVYRSMGHDIRMVMPKYSFIRDRNYNLREVIRLREIPVPLSGNLVWVAVKSGFIPDTRVQVYFLEDDKYFSRNGITLDPDTGHPYPDNDERFIVLVRATIVMLKILSWQPQIIHCVDWFGSMLPFYMKKFYQNDPFYQSSRLILSLVNYDEDGSFPLSTVFKAGINPMEFNSASNPELNGKMSFLKAGILNADKVAFNGQVSTATYPSYFRNWLSDYIQRNPKNFSRIPFGIDSPVWNPDKDDKIAAHYSHRDLSGKSENRKKLAEKYALNLNENRPIVGCIWNSGDFSPLKKVITAVKNADAGFIIAGKTGFEDKIAEFQRSAPHLIGAVKLLTGHSLKQLLAGSNIIVLAPDKYRELLHLKSMKYGAIPVVPKIGYFGDDIIEGPKEGNGFLYDPEDENGLESAVNRALNLYNETKAWTALTKRAMKNDPNWNKIARAYLDIYDEID